MKQYDLILKWVDEYGKITPARMGGTAWGGGFFGSETPKRCRELLKMGILDRKKDGKFKTFYRVGEEIKTSPIYSEIQTFPQGALKF